MKEARPLDRCIRMSGNHRLIPLLDGIVGMLRSVLLQPLENRLIIIKTIGRFLKSIRIHFQEGEQMLVEPGRLVIVTIQQTFPMELCFVDQSRQMDLPAELGVGTTRQLLLHLADRILRSSGQRLRPHRRSFRLC